MTKKTDGKDMKVGWFISASPWVGCPQTLNRVVVHDSSEIATQRFKKWAGKEDIEIALCIPVAIDECEDLLN